MPQGRPSNNILTRNQIFKGAGPARKARYREALGRRQPPRRGLPPSRPLVEVVCARIVEMAKIPRRTEFWRFWPPAALPGVRRGHLGPCNGSVTAAAAVQGLTPTALPDARSMDIAGGGLSLGHPLHGNAAEDPTAIRTPLEPLSGPARTRLAEWLQRVNEMEQAAGKRVGTDRTLTPMRAGSRKRPRRRRSSWTSLRTRNPGESSGC